MLKRSLMPSLWRQSDVPDKRGAEHPFYGMQKEMNRLFDDFFQGLDVAPWESGSGNFLPSIDVREDDKEVIVKVELPGMDEKDIDISLDDNALTIKGEKKEEKEDEGKGYYHLERTFGSFRRTISLPQGIDHQKASATFKRGVLGITLPKTREAKAKAKKIAIKSE